MRPPQWRSKVVTTASLTALIIALTLSSIPAQAISTADGHRARPTRWMPWEIETQMGYEAWGNVAYYLTWDLGINPASADGLYHGPGTNDGIHSIEVGWKDTGFAACRTTAALNGYSGFPTSVYLGVDYTENPGDAVLFIATKDLQPDVKANSGKIYGAWWTCQHGTDEFAPGPGTQMNAQISTYDRPLTALGRAQLQLIPPENAGPGFPPSRAAGGHVVSQVFTWVSNPNMEAPAADTSWAPNVNATKAKVCGGANQGSCFLRLARKSGTTGSTVLQQMRTISTYIPNSTRMQIQAGRPLQYEGAFRCRPSQGNTSACPVVITVAAGAPSTAIPATATFSTSIPNDDSWYFVMRDDLGEIALNSSYFKVLISSQGRTLDVDSQFVSPGLNL